MLKKTLFKLVTWAGIYGLSNDEGLATLLTSAGIDENLVDTVKGFIGEVAPSEIWDTYNDLAVNDDLASAFAKAIDATATSLSAQFQPSRYLNPQQKKQVAAFFASLGNQLKQADFSAERVRQYTEQPAEFWAELLRTHTSNAALPDVPEAVLDQLATFLVGKFQTQFRRELLKILQDNHKAQTAYVVSLLQWAAQANVQNAERLVQISDALTSLAQQQEQQAELLQQVAHLQGLIHQQLQKVAVDFRQFVSHTEAFQIRLSTQLEPALTLPNLAARQGHEFNFKSQYTTFIGRDVELTALWTFVAAQPERRFMWWLVTGPGGMGKSRLALELCQQAQYLGRHVGFLERKDVKNFRWSQWRPQVPTLLVIDYVATDAEAVRNLLAELSRSDQNNNLTVSVRVLLLEREVSDDDWWASWRNDDDLAHSHYYQNEPERLLALPPFDPGDHWRIIRNVHERQKKPLLADKDTTLTKLAELDSKGRPLFAFLVGRALAEGNDISQWNVNNLLDNLLLREEDRIWKIHPAYATQGESHKNLLLIATLTRGLWETDIKQLYDVNLPGLPRKLDNSLYKRMAPIVNVTKYDLILYEGLQPDLVGEYFVLKHLQQLQRRLPNGKKTAQALLQAAWTSDARQVWWMIYQTYRDYFTLCTGATQDLLLDARPLSNAPAKDWQERSKLSYNLLETYRTEEQIEKAEEKYNELSQLTCLFPRDPIIAFSKAVGAVNLIDYYGEKGLFTEAENKYNDLNELACLFQGVIQITLQKAKGAVNMTKLYGVIGYFEQALRNYMDLGKIATQFPIDPQIALQKAMGAVNMVICHGNQGQFQEAEEKYHDLSQLTSQFHNDPLIALHKAMGAVNLTDDYSSKGLFKQAEEKYKDLDELARRFSNDSQLHIKKAMGAVNLAYYYGTQGLFKQAEEKYHDLSQLTSQFSNDPLIALRKAMGAINLIDDYVREGLSKKAEEKYHDLNQLAIQFNKDSLIALRTARGASILLYSLQFKLGQPQRKRLLKDLSVLLSEYSTHPDWQESLPLLEKIRMIVLNENRE